MPNSWSSVRRFAIMSRLGLAEPLVRLARSVEKSNRRAAARAASQPRVPAPKATLAARRSG
jgi:hypothetical protein